MKRFESFVYTAAVVVAGCLVCRLAAQESAAVQLASAGPRFISAPTATAPSVDMSNAPVLQRRISLEMDRVPLGAALKEVAKLARIRVAVSREIVPVDKPLTVHADGITVGAALFEILAGTGLDVQLAADGTSAALVPRARLWTSPSHQAGAAIAGRVTDAITHSPLDQASVRIEGLDVGAVSAADGRYAIHGVASGTYHVVARRVGYAPLTRTVTVVDSTTAADFALAVTPTRLNEMVTTAVGDQRRYEVGNVISTINADSIAPTAPITSLTDLISARAPGVTVEETSGLTGSGEAIRIRGQSSLVLQGDPIVIVDGVRQNNAPGGTYSAVGVTAGAVPSPTRLNDLDFSDVETIDVLKGPAASTEYGTDAANGVVVITTKHGAAGRPQWHASAEDAITNIPERFPTLYYSWGHTTGPSHASVDCPLVPYAFGSGYGSSAGTCAVDSVTTWNPLNHAFYSIFGTGNRQKYDLSVGGGSDATRYFVSGGLARELGVLQMPGVFLTQARAVGLPVSMFNPNGEDQRSVRANTAIRLAPTADLTVSGAYLSAYQRTLNAQTLDPLVYNSPALRDSANGYGYGNVVSYLASYSPIYQFGLPVNQTTDRLTGGMSGNWRPTSWFVGHATVGIDHGSERDEASVLPQVAVLYPSVPAELGIQSSTTDIYTVDLRGTTTIALARAARAVTSIGLQLADTRLQGTTVIAKGITATNTTLNGAVNPAVSQLGNRQAALGGYAEEQLGLADRLFLTGAVRIDAGSGFGQAYSSAVYPKASVSWLVLDRSATTVRVRGAFGASGVQPPNGAALQLYAPTTVWLGGAQAEAVAIANVENQQLQPERSAEYEGGIDIGLWQNRVSVELTGYSKTTHHALVSSGTGWDGGALPYEENVGQVRNTGVEGAVTATVLRQRLVTWDMTLNGSINHNTLVALAPGIASQEIRGGVAQFRFAPGYPLYGYWGPQVQYADQNHDGIIEPNEVTVANTLAFAGSSLPTQEASLGTHLGLRGGTVSVGALVDYRGGFHLMNTGAYYEANGFQSDMASNVRSSPLWQQARDVAVEAILTQGLNGYAPPVQSYEDATYVRFRELSLTYEVPHHLARVLRLGQASVTAAVRNLALWTRYTGTDPEVTNSIGRNAKLTPTSNTYVVNNDYREDNSTVPLLRYWLVRLNVGF